ncbi:hypothetical protein OIU77_021194, partial [Salix suchowensis]
MGGFVWMEEFTDGPPLFAPASSSKRKARTPRKQEFAGWGSTLLIEFLQYIGTSTTNQISQRDVTAIINKYVKDHNLLHPTKKKRVLCDEWLLPLFGRKTINRIRIYDLLEPHFAENKVGSDDDFFDTTDDDEDNNAYHRQKCSASDRKCHSKEKDLVKNNPETFESKIVGSFVRIKSDPNDYLQKNSHMLVQVTGLAQSSRPNDDNFSKEECEDLNQRVRDGSLKRPTIVELEEKVQALHEDITKHWLRGELAFLQKLIDRANEKGKCVDAAQNENAVAGAHRCWLTLKTEPAPEDFPVNIKQGNDVSPKPSLNGVLEIPNSDVASNKTSTWISFSKNSAGNQAVLATPKQSNRM